MDKSEIIRKLQALFNIATEGSGATDAEYQTALLQARKLMAKYNIEMSEVDFANGKLREAHEEDSGIMFNTRYCMWKLPLASVMAKHCACDVMMRRKYNSKSSKILFVGEGENPTIVKEMFMNTVLHIENNIYKIHDELYDCTSMYRYSASDSYAKGFIDGLRKQYEEQDRVDESLSLILVRPESIDEFFKKNDVRSTVYETSSSRVHVSSKYNEGYSDGYNHGKSALTDQKNLQEVN